MINRGYIFSEKASFKESSDNSNNSNKYYLEALLVPFEKISRNGVMYDKESIIESKNKLIGKHLLYNHITDDANILPKGEWVEVWANEDGLFGKAEVYNTKYNADFIEFLKVASAPRVSLQVIGESEQKESNGQTYHLARVNDWLEASCVLTPGFDDAKVKSFERIIAESFKTDKEDFFNRLNKIRNQYVRNKGGD